MVIAGNEVGGTLWSILSWIVCTRRNLDPDVSEGYPGNCKMTG